MLNRTRRRKAASRLTAPAGSFVRQHAAPLAVGPPRSPRRRPGTPRRLEQPVERPVEVAAARDEDVRPEGPQLLQQSRRLPEAPDVVLQDSAARAAGRPAPWRPDASSTRWSGRAAPPAPTRPSGRQATSLPILRPLTDEAGRVSAGPDRVVEVTVVVDYSHEAVPHLADGPVLRPCRRAASPTIVPKDRVASVDRRGGRLWRRLTPGLRSSVRRAPGPRPEPRDARTRSPGPSRRSPTASSTR